MKTLFLSFLCIIMLTGCSDDDSAPAPFEPITIEPVLIGKGFSTDEITSGNFVISTQTDWDAFLINMDDIVGAPLNTNVDFSLNEVIVVIDVLRPDTGHSVNIDTVIENENDITVNYSLMDIGDGFTDTNQPYHIVKIPISSKPVIFQ
ncbi:hypothetical protein WFZ85_04120 [Flavobacterium sp. j3]|uniref:Protease complex subunit PrcB family protein n=1 Tax=Flavobacterium aureirubrum TaxID=3133147 RepID=A0ABU9N5E5_9FLAO